MIPKSGYMTFFFHNKVRKVNFAITEKKESVFCAKLGMFLSVQGSAGSMQYLWARGLVFVAKTAISLRPALPCPNGISNTVSDPRYTARWTVDWPGEAVGKRLVKTYGRKVDNLVQRHNNMESKYLNFKT